jgi:myo-inositol-1(or 4)-monophosphatase
MNDVPDIEEVIAVARAAAAHVKRGFERGAALIEGRGHLVSEADLAAEAEALAAIRGAHPTHDIVAEESASALAPPPAAGGPPAPTWIVDPLDGTRNFVARVPHFAVSIAFGLRDAAGFTPLRGAIVHALTGDVYAAALGQGARWNGDPMSIGEGPRLADGASAVAVGRVGGLWGAARMVAFAVRRGGRLGGPRISGSAALDLAMTARGAFSAFFGHGLAPWDVAAGILLVTEAGGEIRAPDGGRYDPLVDDELVAGRPAAVRAIVGRGAGEF